ncbi:hypothetical protein GCM10022243_29410 [Saccharothrix violaceirubra]|uniref:Poly-gamma-glutamate synthase PgsB/CapB n=1 Tax=Saccharothrix violaceirubra TaxID=413306 RepID=A0A7W7T4S7_9PSEU|nr:poly-gamma-glutamate synthase PgsB [Saccharothrix violaceirubra]MBB4966564.1 poly-gamma-glutamate synthase PgsB/CapB [Saccharothrix violaceirubra]
MTYLYVVYLVMVGGLLMAGIAEQRRHLAHLHAIEHRVLVNGIRGKSSITRLCAGALRGGGLVTTAKTTGTAARFIHPDGTEEPVYRKFGVANVVEQIGIVRRAAAYRSDVLVIECMAVMPDLQEINQSKLIQSTIGVLCNVREDHLAEMGPTLDDVARSLSRSMPVGGVCVTAERDRLHILEKEAAKRDCELIAVDPESVSDEDMAGFTWVTFKENVAIALKVAELLGVNRQLALTGMWSAPPDPGVLSVQTRAVHGKTVRMANVFAANDPESTLMNIERLLEQGAIARPLHVVINCRPDRVERNRQMGELVARIEPDHVVLIGEPTRSARSTIAESWQDRVSDLGGSRGPEELVAEILAKVEDEVSLVAIGNIHGQGEVLLHALDEFEEIAADQAPRRTTVPDDHRPAPDRDHARLPAHDPRRPAAPDHGRSRAHDLRHPAAPDRTRPAGPDHGPIRADTSARDLPHPTAAPGPARNRPTGADASAPGRLPSGPGAETSARDLPRPPAPGHSRSHADTSARDLPRPVPPPHDRPGHGMAADEEHRSADPARPRPGRYDLDPPTELLPLVPRDAADAPAPRPYRPRRLVDDRAHDAAPARPQAPAEAPARRPDDRPRPGTYQPRRLADEPGSGRPAPDPHDPGTGRRRAPEPPGHEPREATGGPTRTGRLHRPDAESRPDEPPSRRSRPAAPPDRHPAPTHTDRPHPGQPRHTDRSHPGRPRQSDRTPQDDPRGAARPAVPPEHRPGHRHPDDPARQNSDGAPRPDRPGPPRRPEHGSTRRHGGHPGGPQGGHPGGPPPDRRTGPRPEQRPTGDRPRPDRQDQGPVDLHGAHRQNAPRREHAPGPTGEWPAPDRRDPPDRPHDRTRTNP